MDTGQLEIKKINDLFSHYRYNELIEYLKNSDSSEKDLYLYFAYVALHDKSSYRATFENLSQTYSDNYAELYYDMAIACSHLDSDSYYSYPTPSDFEMYIDYCLSVDADFALALLEKGKFLFKKWRVREGLDCINRAIQSNSNLLQEKEKAIHNIHIFSYTQDFTVYVSTKDVQILYNEYVSFQLDTVIKKLKLLELSVLLNKKKEVVELSSILAVGLGSMDLYHFNVLLLYFNINNKYFEGALEFAEKIGYDWISLVYQHFHKYREAAEFLYKKYVDQKENKTGGKINLLLEVSELYYKAKKYSLTLESVEKYISDDLEYPEIHSHLQIRSFLGKGKAQFKLGKISEAIDSLKLAYYTAQNIEKPNNDQKELHDEVLFQLGTVFSKKHNDSLRTKRTDFFYVLDEVNSIESCKQIIESLRDNIHFNTTSKNSAKMYFAELLHRNTSWERKIKSVEKQTKENELIARKVAAELIIEVATRALSFSPDDEKILFQLAFNQSKLERHLDSIDTYKKLLGLKKDDSTVMNNLAWSYYHAGQKNKAQELFNQLLKNDLPYDTDLTNSLLGYFIRETDDNQNNSLDFNESREKVENLFNEIVKHQIIGESNSTVRRIDADRLNELTSKVLYKYRAFSLNTIDSLLNSYFYFNSLEKLNDPLDIPINEMQSLDELKYCKIDKDDYKVFCLSLEKENHLMWSHYADSHKGICIGYKIFSLPESIGWGEVNYFSENFDFYRMTEYKENGLIHAGIYSKNILWEYEKEIRLTSINLKNNNKVVYNEKILPHHLKNDNEIRACISEIIIGLHFPEEYIPILQTICDKLNSKYLKLNIPKVSLYKIERVPNYPFKFKTVKYKIKT